MMQPELHIPADFDFFDQRLSAHLTWFSNNLKEIQPYVGNELSFPGLKALAEFAMVYACLDDWRTRIRVGYEVFDQHADKWRNFITAVIEDRSYSEAARSSPPHASFLLFPYLALRGRGYRCPYHERTLGLLHKWGYPGAQEVVPYRLLDRELFSWKAGCSESEPDWHQLFRSTTLAAPGSLAFLDRDGAYSITHTVLYLCDFGARRAPLDRTERATAIRVVECALLHYWRIGDWDLVGELLASLDCLESPASPIQRGAATAFQAIGIDGAVPADQAAATQICHGGSAISPADRFSLCYHTTLVAILQSCISRNRRYVAN